MKIKDKAITIMTLMIAIAMLTNTAMAFTAPNANNARVEFVYTNGTCDGLYINEGACEDDDASTLRIYGEEDIDAEFPYTDPEGPFDPNSPEAPGKDFVVFNPAYIDGHRWMGEGSVYINSDEGNKDADEKVFARQWYVPEYPEPIGDVWVTNPVQIETADIVTEYTYMFIDDIYDDDIEANPTYGHAGTTRLWLPIGSEENQIGLDSFVALEDSDEKQITEIKEIDDFNNDGLKDLNIGTFNPIYGNDDDTYQFLDHEIAITDVGRGANNIRRVLAEVYYIGNDAQDPVLLKSVPLYAGDTLVAGRGDAHVNGDLSFTNPWYVTLEMFCSDEEATFEIGRRVHMGETFFVDGAEYDISMIYGPEDNDNEFTTFKYITIRNPVPKLIEGADYINADGKVYLPGLSIYKKTLPSCTTMPMLPPFNDKYTMVDDIDIPSSCQPCDDCDTMDSENCDIDEDYNTVAKRLILDESELDIQWVTEKVEPRFLTNLCEIFDEDATGCCLWQWMRIHIMPDEYTEMWYPTRTDVTGSEGDFLMVSSWEAPNSCDNRVKFAYDADNSKDIYVNEMDIDRDGNGNDYVEQTYNSVRIYGEDSIDAAFPYEDPEGPFNKLSDDAPGKDFATFNPAYYGFGSDVTVDGEESSAEKVFVRQWYVPKYIEPRGIVGDNEVSNPDTITSPDIVTEFSYMLLDGDNNPAAGTAGTGNSDATDFWMPTGSSTNQIGLNNYRILRGENFDTMVRLREVGDFNGDGLKDINIMVNNDLVKKLTDNAVTLSIEDIEEDQVIMFLDHEIFIQEINNNSAEVTIDVWYLGNSVKKLVIDNAVLDACGSKLSSGRNWESSQFYGRAPDFEHPWYVELDCDEEDNYQFTIGRLLYMGETFFVDGAEYDISMIYGPNSDDFMYITLRNPIPKKHDRELRDLDIVKEHINAGNKIPMLPPFNRQHTIVDDINIPTSNCVDTYGDKLYPEMGSCLHDSYDEVRERVVWADSGGPEPAFDCFYIEETTEPRFTTNLLEILHEENPETWQWLHIITRPDHYTAMVYPDVNDIKNKSGAHVVDGDFIITTSGPKENQTEVCGDVNCDGFVDIGDAILVMNHVGYENDPQFDLCNDWSADVNCDGFVDIGDAILIMNHVGYSDDPSFVLNCCV